MYYSRVTVFVNTLNTAYHFLCHVFRVFSDTFWQISLRLLFCVTIYANPVTLLVTHQIW